MWRRGRHTVEEQREGLREGTSHEGRRGETERWKEEEKKEGKTQRKEERKGKIEEGSNERERRGNT